MAKNKECTNILFDWNFSFEFKYKLIIVSCPYSTWKSFTLGKQFLLNVIIMAYADVNFKHIWHVDYHEAPNVIINVVDTVFTWRQRYSYATHHIMKIYKGHGGEVPQILGGDWLFTSVERAAVPSDMGW